MPRRRNPKFEPGTVVVFEPANFNQDWWGKLPEAERIKYYGSLGYGAKKQHLFVYLTEILDADGEPSGHCVLVSLDDQHIETMRHTSDFRAATEEEF